MRLLLFLIRRLNQKRFLPRPVRIMRGMIGLGIVLSVATLLSALGVASGFEKKFKQALLDFHAHITIFPDPIFSLTPETLRAAWQKAGLSPELLVEIKPYLYREALLIHQGVIKGVVLKGVEGLEAKGELLLGEALAKKMGLQVMENGERIVKILIPKGEVALARDMVRLPVAGTFRSGLYELDDQFALIDLDQLQKLFGVSAQTQGYELKLKDPDLAPVVAQQLSEQLPPSLSIQDWTDLNQPLLAAFRLEKWFFKILLGFMVFVSVLNLMASILLSIFRQKKKIAILRAHGLGIFKVRRLFALEGLWLGGRAIGLGLGLGIGLMTAIDYGGLIPLEAEVYFLEKLPIDFVWFDVLSVVFLSGLGVVLTAWWAANRISAMSIRGGLHEP